MWFPHPKREYEAVFCFEDIKEEFKNNEKGKPLKDIHKKLIGINFEGDEDFFKEDVEGWFEVVCGEGEEIEVEDSEEDEGEDDDCY